MGGGSPTFGGPGGDQSLTGGAENWSGHLSHLVFINLLQPAGPGVRGLQRTLSDLGLSQLVTEPTHLHPTPTMLDLMITNLADSPRSAVVLPEPIADHQPVLLRAELRRQRPPPPPPVTRRRWERVDWDAMCLSFLLADWDPLYSAQTVDEKLAALMAVWDAVADEHCPMVTVRQRRPACPWLRDNPELMTAMEDRDEARRMWQRTRTPESRRTYQQLRNTVKCLLIRARRNFLCDSLVSDKQEFWSNIKRFSVQSAQGPASGDDSIRARADEFNEHFASVGPRIAAEVQRAAAPDSCGPRPPRVCSSALELCPATLPELSYAIRRMSSSRAIGIDGVPLLAVKKCFAVIGPHLLHVVNSSISTRTFPSAWKIARVVPIHKSGSQTDVNNFRPISILSVLSKVTEKVICTQLMSYLLDNALLSPCQYAYRPRHSTEDALIDAVEWISKVIDNGEVASMTTIDLSKAFDSVDHGVLLDKLEWYGVRSDWFRSYLMDRKQIVPGGSNMTLPLTHGVAQGSIVGPILFLIFINDLSSFLPHGRLLSYADDTQLLDHSPPDVISLSHLKNRVTESIRELENWFKSNSLKMNPNKTDFTLFGTKSSLQKASFFEITISDSVITPSPTLKVLGTTLDQSMTWESHISAVVRKCNAILLSLYKIRHHFTPEALVLLVQAHVFPHVLYCVSVWGGAAQCHLSRVQKVINFAARLVTGERRSARISPALESLGWPRIEEIVRRRDCEKVFSALHECDRPPALRALFVRRSQVSARETRSTAAGDLQLAKCHLSATQRTFSYRAARAWNALPPTVTAAQSRGELMRAVCQTLIVD